MKKITVIICALLMSYGVNAQIFGSRIELDDYNNYNGFHSLYANKDYQINGVRELAVKIIDPKTKKLKREVSCLVNKDGVTYERRSMNKKGILTSIYSYHLIDSVRFDKQLSIYKKDTFTVLNTYNKEGKITQINYLNNKNKLTSLSKYTYGENGKMASLSYLNKKNIELTRYEYSYYENGSRKDTRYFKKNKLKKIYNYSCEPMGEVEKKVAQQSICKKRTYDADSSFLEIYEGRDNKGHTIRRVSKFTRDSLLKETINFNKNDKETKKYIYSYENKKTKSVQVFVSGKLKYTSLYTYAPNGLYASYQIVKPNGKITSFQSFDYQY